jgi:hypothetical protein
MEAPPLTIKEPVPISVLSVVAETATVLNIGFGVIISAHDNEPVVVVTNAILLVFGRASGRVNVYDDVIVEGG